MGRACDNRGVNRSACLFPLVLAIALSAQQTKKPMLGSAVFDWTRLAAVKNANGGERRAIVDATTATMSGFESHVTTLAAGRAAHAPHRHPDEEVVIVKEGTIEVNINGKIEQAGAGSMFFFGSNDLHGMKNVGSAPATYFVIRIVTAATPAPAVPAK